MGRPLDDLHPIVRESCLQEEEDRRVMASCSGSIFGPVMQAYGINDVHRLDAVAEVINGTARGVLLGARRRGGILDEEVLTATILQTLLLGVRLVRKGLL